MFTLKIVTSENELKEIFRLRYRAQVEELGRREHTGSIVDHVNKELIDPIDESSINMGAYRDDQLVGCIRLSMNNSDHFTSYRNKLGMDDFAGPQPDKYAFVSRLVVDTKLRHSRLHLLLQLFCFEVGAAYNVRFCFIECVDYLKKYYQKFGFQAYTDKSVAAGFGVLSPLVLDLRGIDHLRQIQSPFLGIYETMMAGDKMTYTQAA